MVFVKRRLATTPDKLGEKLRTLRRTAAFSLDLMEERTRIQRKYLEALEWGRYDLLPEPLYTRNFLRSYARVLQADESYLLELYEAEVGRVDLLAPHRLPRERVSRSSFIVPGKLWRYTGALSVFFAALVFFVWQTSRVIAPPKISLADPSHDVLVREALIPVVGHVDDQDVAITVNGVPVPVDASQTFTTSVPLSAGPNEILITARRRYSRSAVIKRSVVYDAAPYVSVGLDVSGGYLP